ncbi:MAG: immunoglobulin domain-containing protein [Opitutaceae bacterium]|nr:immunoglobulin domain-containing protein [Opitutaceae bacterium]
MHPKANGLLRRALVLTLCAGLLGPLAAQEMMTVTIAGKTGVVGATNGAASDARFNSPTGIAVDASGNVFVADTNNAVIRKISPDGMVTTFAGTAGFSGHADGTGPAARFLSPQALAIDRQGNLYVGDYDSMIRKITPAGVVTTLAGAFGQFGTVDGLGANARLRAPRGIVVDDAGTIYVADTSSYAIRKITPAGLVTTLAGAPHSNGSLGEPLDGTGTNARFGSPTGIVLDKAGNLIVSDAGWRLIRKVTPAGIVTTLAGNRNGGGIIDGIGSSAYFGYPQGMAIAPSGDIYLIEREMQVIRRITPAGAVTTIIGQPGLSGATDGPDRDARFNWPDGIAIDAAGRFFIADTRNYTIRQRLPVYAPTFSVVPRPATVVAGASAILTAQATGTPTPTYQWQKNGVDIPGATSGTLTIASARGEDAGAYGVTATNIAGSNRSVPVSLAIALPPSIALQPLSRSIVDGQSATLSVTAISSTALSYRWQRNGVDLPGATGATLTLSDVIPDTAGIYTVVVSNAAGSITAPPATITVLSSRFANLSVRTTAGNDASALIVGFVVAGAEKPLLIRGIGAALAQFGVAGALQDPKISLYQGPVVVDSNDDWGRSANAPQIAAAAIRLGAFDLPGSSVDAALLRTVGAGALTVWVTPSNGNAGIALAEVYDANITGNSRLVNMSARAPVDSHNPLIAGFVIAGNVRKRLLVRAIGPGLIGFGVSNALLDPRLNIFQNNIAIIAGNNDWNDDPVLQAAGLQVGAFPLSSGSKDAALILSLDPGAYSAQVTGTDNTSGTALVEVYELPQS